MNVALLHSVIICPLTVKRLNWIRQTNKNVCYFWLFGCVNWHFAPTRNALSKRKTKSKRKMKTKKSEIKCYKVRTSEWIISSRDQFKSTSTRKTVSDATVSSEWCSLVCIAVPICWIRENIARAFLCVRELFLFDELLAIASNVNGKLIFHLVCDACESPRCSECYAVCSVCRSVFLFYSAGLFGSFSHLFFSCQYQFNGYFVTCIKCCCRLCCRSSVAVDFIRHSNAQSIANL